MVAWQAVAEQLAAWRRRENLDELLGAGTFLGFSPYLRM